MSEDSEVYHRRPEERAAAVDLSFKFRFERGTVEEAVAAANATLDAINELVKPKYESGFLGVVHPGVQIDLVRGGSDGERTT